MDQSSFSLTPQEAVQVLLARHEFSGRVKAAFGLADIQQGAGDAMQHVGSMLPSGEQASQFFQNVMTPPEGNNPYHAIRAGLIGAGAGALGGAGASLFSKNRRNWARNALTGALVGGGLGAAYPTASSMLGKAFEAPPSVQEQEGRKNTELAAANQFAQRGAIEPDLANAAASGGTQDLPKQSDNPQRATDLGTLASQAMRPGDSQQAALAHADNNMYGNAAADMGPVAARALAQGAAGGVAGRLRDRQIALRKPEVTKLLGKPAWRGRLGAAAGFAEPFVEPYVGDFIKQLLGDQTGKTTGK